MVFLRELAGSSRSSALFACSFQLLLTYDVESALSMDRIHQVMLFCETATWAHRSSVAHLVSLHISYSHRTPREGVRSLSGESVGVTSTNFSCRMTRRQQNGSVWLLNLSCFPSCFARVFPRTDSKDSTAPHAASRLRPASLDILTDYN